MRIYFIFIGCLLFSCSKSEKTQQKELIILNGTWKLISATTIQGDSINNDDLKGKEMIKIFNESHFSFLNHDVNNGKDSAAFFVSGGGKYLLEDNRYTEFLEYCNYRKWEGNRFEFTVEIQGDTLIQSGIEKIEELGVDRKIIETYVKL